MSLRKLEVEFLGIPGVSSPVRPEIAFRGENSFETEIYASFNGLFVFDKDVNTIAYFVRPETPDEEWVKEQAEKLKLNKDAVENAYDTLHDGIWEKYIVRAHGILAKPPFSKRIINPKLDRKSEKAMLLRKYKITKASEKDYFINGGEVTEVDWPEKDGVISKELADILNAKYNTRIVVDNSDYVERLRILCWCFRLHERPRLGSLWNPWDSFSSIGSLVGRSVEKTSVALPPDIYEGFISFGDKLNQLQEEWSKLCSKLPRA